MLFNGGLMVFNGDWIIMAEIICDFSWFNVEIFVIWTCLMLFNGGLMVFNCG